MLLAVKIGPALWITSKSMWIKRSFYARWRIESVVYWGNHSRHPGYVIARTPLCEILYYPPSSHYPGRQGLTPVLIVPSWINKFYILDLDPQDSFIGWICSQKFPLFVLSWVNPTCVEDIGLEDYVYSAARALSLVHSLSGVKPHFVGHCAGGLLMSLAASYAQQTYGVSPCTLTYLTSIFDFDHFGHCKDHIQQVLVPTHTLLWGVTISGISFYP